MYIKRAVPILIAILLMGCGVIKKSEPYKMSLQLLDANTAAVEQLGGVKGYGYFPKGSIKTSTDGTGVASLSIKVKGKVKNAILATDLVRDNNAWTFKSASLKIDGADSPIDLMPGVPASLSGEGVVNGLTVTDTFFAKEKWGQRMAEPTFTPGEVVYYHIITKGYATDDNSRSNYSADLTLLSPDSKELLNMKDILKDSGVLEDGTMAAFFNVNLVKDMPEGQYKILVTVHDNMAQKQVETTALFNVVKEPGSASTTPATTVPSEEPK